MTPFWSRELWRLLGAEAGFFLFGLILRQPAWTLFMGTLAYFLFFLWRLAQFHRWFLGTRNFRPPDIPEGIWMDLYQKVYQLQKGNRRRERKLKVLLGKFQASADALPDAVVVINASDQILWFNAAAKGYLALDTTDVGRPIVNILRSPVFLDYLQSGDYGQSLVFNPFHNDDTHFSLRIIPYGGDQRLLLVQDITDLRRLERVRSDFVANVSHELKTPLTVISGFVENFLLKEDECSRRWRRPLELISQQAMRMRQIVTDLLLLAKLEASGRREESLEILDIPALLKSIRDEVLMPGLGDVAAIGLELDAHLRLKGNEAELRSAFSNLLLNAIKYTPHNGRVTVRCYVDGEGCGCVEVEDTGEGISPEHIPRLTERFYRVDVGRSRKRGGTGLGLAIVKHVLQHHDAKLDISSKPGAGSCFRCRFPPGKVALVEMGQV
ncbi:MAG: phosphate regulon sensor histidine kinase PhoR [Gammaproteobacteria bacterium RIFOXYA12_FULL_61_12]|nr:MAG: phosphate regulon sensor histidine kinase PhoR [Gammaproteobacteria bacterium RIFOXYD12_FULL_61_37]OGT93656.1 MAG: phosphate regulon sensor histidine kinase PhoR [Gammaproteobacteria bacterium RIFOXYA12_FULL_61_12]